MSLYCLRQHVGRVFFQAFCQVICKMCCFLLGSAAKLFWTACLSNVFWTCFFLEAHYSLEALGFMLAARCLHYPFIACCLLLAISFHRCYPCCADLVLFTIRADSTIRPRLKHCLHLFTLFCLYSRRR